MEPIQHPPSAAGKAEHLASPVLLLPINDELADLRAALGAAPGHRARTLVKREDLAVVLIALLDGARVEEHRAPASVTIQGLAGTVVVHVGGDQHELGAGGLLVLAPGAPHALEATADSAVLLTMAR
jgi:quercetin dioxygenase-like cupin family protein